MKYLKNLQHILKHKWYVFIECWKLRIIFQGIIHDLSKFSLIEFIGYSNKFFKINPDEKDKISFQYAWLHHQKRNKHHWEYWVVNSVKRDSLEMPQKFVIEMLADWRAMSRQFDNDVKQWYDKNKHKMILHNNTIKKIEKLL